MSGTHPIEHALRRAPIRLVMVAEVRLYREGLSAALGQYEQFTVAGSACGAAEALQLVRQIVPDVAVIDIALAESLTLFRDLRALRLATKILAFGVDDNSAAIIRCAEAGAAGYVTLNASSDDLATAIERAADGELECGPRLAAELFRHLADRTDARPLVPASGTLTRREQEVLQLVTQGLSNKEIGATLHIAEATVKNHVHHLLEKLKVASRVQAAVCASGDGRRPRQALLPRRTDAAGI